MKKQNKQIAQPVSVSDCIPVYVGKNLKYWVVRVSFSGDLLTNSDYIEKWRKIFEKHPYLLNKNPFFRDVMAPVLKSDIIVPNERHLTRFCGYNHQQNVSVVEYKWPDGLFGCGGERAWQFRISMLSQINQRKK